MIKFMFKRKIGVLLVLSAILASILFFTPKTVVYACDEQQCHGCCESNVCLNDCCDLSHECLIIDQKQTLEATEIESGIQLLSWVYCPRCGGSNKIDCPFCDNGRMYSSYDCPKCDGGIIEKTYTCTTCGGTGNSGIYSGGQGFETDEDCSSCNGTGKITETSSCGNCGGDGTISDSIDCPHCDDGTNPCPYCDYGNVYVIDDAPLLYFNGQSYIGGTEDAPTKIILDKDVDITWETSYSGLISVYTDFIQIKESDETKKYSINVNSGQTYSTVIRSQNVESINNESGGQDLYFELIIDKERPLVTIDYCYNGVWTKNYWQGQNDIDDGSVLSISPTEKFRINVQDTQDVTVKMQWDNLSDLQYEPGTEIEGLKDDTEYIFTITDESGNQSYVKVDCGYKTPDIYINEEVLKYGEVFNESSYYEFDKNVEITWKATLGGEITIRDKETYEVVALIDTDKAGSYELSTEQNSTNTYLIETADHSSKELHFYEIFIDKQAPIYNMSILDNLNDYHVTKYYEINGMYYAKYENAEQAYVDYNFKSFVKTSYWSDVRVFGETLAQGEVPKEGTYYKLYNGTSYICYFSKTNLDKRLREDFAGVVRTNYYNGSSLSSSKMFEDMYSNKINVNGIEVYLVSQFVFEQKDSTQITLQSVDTKEFWQINYGDDVKDIFKVVPGGIYKITEIDSVGNVTEYYICFDTTMGDVVAEISNYDGIIKDVVLSAEELNNGVFYYDSFKITSLKDYDSQSIVKVRNQGKTSWYRLFDEEMPALTFNGEYEITIYDRSGNKMSFTVNIGALDIEIAFNGEIISSSSVQSSPQKHMYKQDVTVSWNDSTLGTVRITQTDTGATVFEGSTSQAGSYEMTCIDGISFDVEVININQQTNKFYRIIIDKKAPTYNMEQIANNQSYHVSKYYEINGMYYAKYENAEQAYVDFAMKSQVVMGVWNNVEIFAEVLADGEVALSGNYYKYYNNNSYSCYFSLENLTNELKRAFSKKVRINYYNGSSLSSSKVFEDMYNNEININGVTAYLISNYSFKNVDSTLLSVKDVASGEIIDINYGININSIFQPNKSALYEITETDEVGNVSKYYIYHDGNIGSINVTVSNYSTQDIQAVLTDNELQSGLLYYETFKIASLNDIDPETMVSVNSSKGTNLYRLFDEEMPALTEAGKYDISIYDRSGNKMSFTVNIGTENVGTSFYKNSSSVNISINKLILSNYEEIKIEYNGYEIMYDSKGNAVNASLLEYEFDNEGAYRVFVTLNGETYSYYYEFYKGLPTFSYENGISNKNAVSNVILEYDVNKYVLEIRLNGEVYKYLETINDNTATVNIEYKYANNGEYTIALKHKYSTSTDTDYKIEFLMNVILEPFLVGVENYGNTTDEVHVDWYEEMTGVIATISKDESKETTYEKSKEIKDVGDYVVKVKTSSGRLYSFSFSIIEKDKPYQIIYNSRITSAIPSAHNSTVQFKQIETKAIIVVVKDGKELGSFKWGETLTEEGDYAVTIYNGSDVFYHKFTIDTTAPYGHLIGVEENGRTNDVVTFVWGEEAVNVQIQKNAEPATTYNQRDSIVDGGVYLITMIDRAGNSKTYAFEIDKSVGISVSVDKGLISSTSVWIDTWEDLDIKMTKDGESFDFVDEIKNSGFYTLSAVDDYENEFYTDFMIVTNAMQSFKYELPDDYEWQTMLVDGQIATMQGKKVDLTKEGHYSLIYKNSIDSSKETVDVYIDTTAPTVETLGFTNGGIAEGVASVKWSEDNVFSSIKHNGMETLSYANGQEISRDGDYIITLSDSAGNTTVVTFSKLWKLNTAGKVAMGIGGIAIVGFAIELFRKRRIRFK